MFLHIQKKSNQIQEKLECPDKKVSENKDEKIWNLNFEIKTFIFNRPKKHIQLCVFLY